METNSSQIGKNVDLTLTKDNRVEGAKFSKMKDALFKKAKDLSILCGVQIAIIIFSIGRQPILFGNPDVESVVRQFVDATHPTAPRFYMKMKKAEEEKKGKEKSIDDNFTHRPLSDYDLTNLTDLQKLYEEIEEFEKQVGQEIAKRKDSKFVPEMNVASSSTVPTRH